MRLLYLKRQIESPAKHQLDNSSMGMRGLTISENFVSRICPLVFRVPKHLRRRCHASPLSTWKRLGPTEAAYVHTTEGTSASTSTGCPSIRRRIGARVARTKSIDQLN